VNKKPLPVTAHDGRMAIVLAEAAVKSLKTGRPVKVK
jgi:predicted dehydrogenase